jgi:hypothetical protein
MVSWLLAGGDIAASLLNLVLLGIMTVMNVPANLGGDEKLALSGPR